MSVVTLVEQIKCVEREIGLRERVYPKFIATKRITQPRAERELEHMRAVKATLEALLLSPGTWSEVCRLVERQSQSCPRPPQIVATLPVVDSEGGEHD